MSEFWDRDQEILFLGSWCLRQDRRAEWECLRYRVMASPWDDRTRFYNACRELSVYYERNLFLLGDYLNSAHGVSLGPRYWRILIGPWLLRYMHAAYDRYVHLREALDQDPGLRTVIMDPQSFRTPMDFGETADFISQDPYNLQIFSQQLSGLGQKFPARKLTARWCDSDCRPREGRWRGVVKEASKWGLRLAGGVLSRTQPGRWVALCQMCPRSQMWALAWRTKLRAVPIEVQRQWPFALGEPTFDERRNGLAGLPAVDEFERIFVRSLPGNVPVLYVEAFQKARNDALAMAPNKPAAIVSAIWAMDDRFKFLAAESAERGSHLVAVQHGGGYGIFRFAPTELHESLAADSYMVWGWADGRSQPCRNLPHPRLSSFLTVRRRPEGWRRPGEVLYVATAHPRYLWRFESLPVGTQWEEYFQWQLRFLTAASNRLRANLIVRPYAQEYGQAVRRRIADRFPDVRWDKGVPFRKRLRTVGLAVIDHSATSFLETLTADIPTVLFWDPRRWEVRPEAEPYFDSLRTAGILWDTPEGACAKVEEVYQHPSRWWDRAAVQEVRQRFVERYALAKRNWVDEWARAIEEHVALREAETIPTA